MRPTLELLGDLAEQTRSFVQVELSLVRAELRERGASISSSLKKVGVGLISSDRIRSNFRGNQPGATALWDSCRPRVSYRRAGDDRGRLLSAYCRS